MKKPLSILLVISIVMLMLSFGAPTVSAYSTGNIITFGSYPQTRVSDQALINTLNLLDPDINNIVNFGGSKYRKVFFTTAINSYQAENGYSINTVYWFKFEPIRWRILFNNSGELFVMAESVLDSKTYHQVDENITWEDSTLRSWLNNDFYNTAFSTMEKIHIKISTVVNDDDPWFGTEGGSDTNDNVFLLAYADTVNTSYGFSSNYETYDAARKVQGTDFSKSNGLCVVNSNPGIYNCDWWLRSIGKDPWIAGTVSYSGDVCDFFSFVIYTRIGVRPVLKLSGIFPSVTSKTDTTVSLFWYEEVRATGYNIYNGTTKVNEIPVTDTSYIVLNLSPNTNYSFTVKAVNTGGEFLESAPLFVTTLSVAAPLGLTSPSKTDTSVDLSWDAVIGATGYDIYTGLTKVNIIPIESTTYTVTGLTRKTFYSFTVKAINEDGESAESSPLLVKTEFIYSTGDIIDFGSYPQTRVYDSSLIAALNELTLGADSTVTYGESKYKMVYFTQYAPYSQQARNGYSINTVYWFKFEPIQWRVLSNTDGELFIMAEKILDSKEYNLVCTDVAWETCTMRSWLNDDFYNTAFSSTEKTQINTSTVINEDNPWYDTSGGNDTNDKVYFLSYEDSINTLYGFNTNYSNDDSARQTQGTEFSKSSGLYVDDGSYSAGYCDGNSYWWLRSPGYIPINAGYVCEYGCVHGYGYEVDILECGVRPALKLDLSSVIFTSVEDSSCVVERENGYIYGLRAGITKEKFESSYVQLKFGYALDYSAENLGTGSQVNVVETASGNIASSFMIVIFGDVNGDGNIDSMDAGAAIDYENHRLNLDPPFDEIMPFAGDVNGDGEVDSIDAGIIVDAENFLVMVNQVTGLVV